MSDQPEQEPTEKIQRASDGLTYLLPLDDSAIPMTVVEIVEYLDEDGDHAYGYRVQGTQSPAQVAGLLEVVKCRFLGIAHGSPDI
jgi:hypothetical protein